MAEETAKKKRTLEEQIADVDSGNVPELARLLARERTRLAEKALTKRDFPAAVKQLEVALETAKKLIPSEQTEF